MVKKNSFGLEKIMHKYLQDFFSFLFSSVEGGLEDSLKKFSNLAHIKEKWKRYMISVIIMTAGVVMLAFGIGTLIESVIIIWKPGVMHIFVGLVFIFIALIYKKFR